MLQTVAAAEPFVPVRPRSQIVHRVVLYALLASVSLLYFVPFIWSVVTSFKTIPDSVNVTLIPHPFTTEGWRELWTQYDFKLYLRNSLFLAVVVTATNMFLGALGGYAFARLRFPGRELLFVLVLGTLMIPDQLRLIPVFVLLTKWHLVGGFTGYILISCVTATNLFFMRQYFLTIPRDYEEAAKLDGAGSLQDLLAGDAAARRAGHRSAHDPPVPGDVERLLLAADHLRPGQHRALHRAARPRAIRADLPDATGRRSWPGAWSRSCRSSRSLSRSSATSSQASPPRG